MRSLDPVKSRESPSGDGRASGLQGRLLRAPISYEGLGFRGLGFLGLRCRGLGIQTAQSRY